jgi:hypothetical protein
LSFEGLCHINRIKNGIEANLDTMDTLSDQNLENIILPDVMAVFAPDADLRVDTLDGPIFKPENMAILINKSRETVSLFVKNHGLTDCAVFFAEKPDIFKFYASFSYYKF